MKANILATILIEGLTGEDTNCRAQLIPPYAPPYEWCTPYKLNNDGHHMVRTQVEKGGIMETTNLHLN